MIYLLLHDTDWYAGSIAAAGKANLVAGYEDGNFHPNQTISREEMAVMVQRVLKFTGVTGKIIDDLSVFRDSVSISGWAIDAMQHLSGMKLIQGLEGGLLAPKTEVDRAQAATILRRMLLTSNLIN